MNTLVKSIAFTTLSLAMASTANATQLDGLNINTAINSEFVEFEGQIAQSSSSLANETRSRRFIDEMIMLRMKMVEAAEEALQSPNSEIKRMAQQTIKTNNTEIKKMMEMRERFKLYEDG